MELNQLLTYFQGVKSLSGKDHYKALCPCHNDHKPSLDIILKDNKILMACPVCGADGEKVMQKLGLDVKELFYERRNNKAQKPNSVDYMYSDTLKKSRYYSWDNKKQRYEKAFCWWHKKGGKWKKGANKEEPPLYKQSNIKLAVNNKKIIYIAEGEKDVDTLTNKLGLYAVCSPHGAGQGKLEKKWRDSFNRLFDGAEVAIIPDNDKPGKSLSAYIAAQIQPFAKSVKVLDLAKEWDNLKPKGDITDIYESTAPLPNKRIADIVRDKLEALALTTDEYTELYINNANELTAKINQKYHKQKRVEENCNKPNWVEKDNLNEQRYITFFAEKYGVKCINNKLYSVDGVIKDGKAQQTIIKDILSIVKTNHGDKSAKLLRGIKAYCYTEPLEPCIDKLHCKNGTLSKDENGLFTVFSEEKEFSLNRFPVSYNPNAPTPERFLNYLGDVYNADDIQTLQQYCGYCLLPTTVLQIALFIIGEGGEGKSVLGSILNKVIGEKNVYNDSIGVLDKPFGVANVENKLLFIDDDLSENALKNARNFKVLITNRGKQSANKKFEQENEIEPYVRFICFGNFILQALYDNSDGFYRRQIILEVKPKDKNRVDNKFLDREIFEKESEGVMMWLVTGLNELIKNNYELYLSERTKEKSESLKRENDSVYMFLNECNGITIKKGVREHSANLYEAYKKYCYDNGLVELKKKSFIDTLKSKGKQFGIKKLDYPFVVSSPFGNKQARGFEGVEVKGDYFKYSDYE